MHPDVEFLHPGKPLAECVAQKQDRERHQDNRDHDPREAATKRSAERVDHVGGSLQRAHCSMAHPRSPCGQGVCAPVMATTDS